MDLISIIVPVYNVEKYLTRCIDSILNQSYRNIEIILVDDGSPDNCGAICDKYAKKDARIKVIHKKNGGLSSARNAGIEISTGDYIGFIDSDDWIAEDMYEHLLRLIKDTKSDVACCRWRDVYDEIAIKSDTDSTRFNIYEEDEILYNFFKGEFKSATCPRLYKRSLLKKIRFYEGRVNEDYLFSYEIFSSCKRVVQSEAPKYMYYVNNISITRNGLREKDLDYIFVCNEVLNMVKRSSNYKKFEKYAEIRLSRASFTLLMKLAYYGSKLDHKRTQEIKKILLTNLRRDYVKLIKSNIIPINRKIVITLTCININIVEISCKIYKKIKKET